MDDPITAEDTFRCFRVKDETVCFCLAIEVGWSFSHQQVLAVLKQLVTPYGTPLCSE